MAEYDENNWLVGEDTDDDESDEEEWQWFVYISDLQDGDEQISLAIRDIRFTHGVISRKFRMDNRGEMDTAPEGPTLEQTYKEILENRDLVNQMPKIPVMYHNGRYWAVNGNRRLFVYKMLASHGVLDTIPVIKKPFNAGWFNQAYSTQNEGASVVVRGVVMVFYEQYLQRIYMTHLRSTLANLSRSSESQTTVVREPSVTDSVKSASNLQNEVRPVTLNPMSKEFKPSSVTNNQYLDTSSDITLETQVSQAQATLTVIDSPSVKKGRPIKLNPMCDEFKPSLLANTLYLEASSSSNPNTQVSQPHSTLTNRYSLSEKQRRPVTLNPMCEEFKPSSVANINYQYPP